MQQLMHLGDSLLQGTANRRGVTKLRKQLRNCCRYSMGGWLLNKATAYTVTRGDFTPASATPQTREITVSKPPQACSTSAILGLCPAPQECGCALSASAFDLKLGGNTLCFAHCDSMAWRAAGEEGQETVPRVSRPCSNWGAKSSSLNTQPSSSFS